MKLNKETIKTILSNNIKLPLRIIGFIMQEDLIGHFSIIIKKYLTEQNCEYVKREDKIDGRIEYVLPNDTVIKLVIPAERHVRGYRFHECYIVNDVDENLYYILTARMYYDYNNKIEPKIIKVDKEIGD